MITEVKTFWCSGKHPSDDDIRQAMNILEKSEYPIKIELCWYGADNVCYGGHHSVWIGVGDEFDTIKERLPKIYGV